MDNRILLICPTFYGYYKDLIIELERIGYDVDFATDQVKITSIDLALNKLFKKFISKKQDKYVKKLCVNHNIAYKYLIMVNCKLMSENNIVDILKNIKYKKSIYYAWDSVQNFQNIKNFIKYFDKCFSFDDYDCDKYKFTFLPLFYTCDANTCRKVYDYSVIMNIYPSKAKGYLNLINIIPKDKKGFVYLKVKSRFQDLYFRIKSREYRKIPKKYIKYKNLDRETTYKIFASSKSVLDIPLENQCGLTIRTFEVLALNTKLITTNTNISKYDFYTPNNIFIYKKSINIDNSFFERKFDKKYEINSRYSVSNFIEKLIK